MDKIRSRWATAWSPRDPPEQEEGERQPATLETLPVGATGELWVRGYQVMKGYFDKPAAAEQMAKSTPEQAKAGMEMWMAWAKRAGSAIVDLGAPLGAAASVKGGAAGSKVSGFSILQADSSDAVRKVLKDHPPLNVTADARRGGLIIGFDPAQCRAAVAPVLSAIPRRACRSRRGIRGRCDGAPAASVDSLHAPSGGLRLDRGTEAASATSSGCDHGLR